MLPDLVLRPAVGLYISREGSKSNSEYVPLRELAPSLRYDFTVVKSMLGKQDEFEKIKAETLLVSGSKTGTYLKEDLDTLQGILPNAQRVELEGLDHGSPWNHDGQPDGNSQILFIANAMRNFLSHD